MWPSSHGIRSWVSLPVIRVKLPRSWSSAPGRCPIAGQEIRFLSCAHNTATEAEITAARKWLSEFTPSLIPKDACEISYARSSGPGGQNVNK